MISLKNIVFDGVRQIKTLSDYKLKENYYQVVYEHGKLNVRTMDGLYPLTVPNRDDENYLVTELKNDSRILVCGEEVGAKSVHEYYIFKLANWTIKGITVTDSFLSGKGRAVDELNRKYVIQTSKSKYLLVARPSFGERNTLAESPAAFMLLGENGDKFTRLNCAIKKTDDDDDYIEVRNEEPFRNFVNDKDELITEVVEVPLNFRFIPENEQKAAVIRSRIEGKYSVYLEIWKEYCRERELNLIKTIADCGILKIDRIDSDGAARYIETSDKALSNFKEKLKDTGINDCYVFCKRNNTDEKAFADAVNKFRDLLLKYKTSEDSTLVADIRNILAGEHDGLYLAKVSLDIEETLKKGKPVLDNSNSGEEIYNERYICLSGFKIRRQLDNYKEQFNRIMSGDNPMKELAEILLLTDDNNEATPKYRPLPRHTVDLHTAISYFPNGKPRTKQAEALKVALESPDIAIIWGPPGTGKTTLITAILHAIENKEKPLNGTLLTTFQHDALDNLMEKVEVNGLPCLRYGGRDVANSSVFSDSLIETLNEKAQKLAEKYPEYKTVEILDKIENSIEASYRIQLSYSNVIRFVENILNYCTAELMPDELADLKKFAEKIRQKFILKTDKSVLNAINKLRTDDVSYGDDGPNRYEYLLQLVRLRGLNLLLQPLAEYEKAVEKSDFAKTRTVREKLLINFCANNRCCIDKDEAEKLRGILNQLKTDIERTLAERYELEEVAISKYVSTFKNNLSACVAAIKRYNKYSGVTENQLDNNIVQELLKNKNEFENVIVDEAARSSPMDLFVVMSRASKRIILVGDHCQLPQFVEKDKFNKAIAAVRQNVAQNKGVYDDSDVTDVSLFEKLIRVAEKLTKNDGINRVVMLDEQFRMPSDLGNYVSDVFYAGKIKSNPENDKYHAHGIKKYSGKCMVFKDIPRSGEKNKEEFVRTSRYRAAEVEWIVNDVAEVLADENSKELSIGIMSFYKAQCGKISEKLAESSVGILRYADEKAKEYTLCEEYRKRGNTVYVGTVDSFQGRQFDIVYLSVTVSNEKGDVGHLKSVNRLCVGMSRALRLMIVAGDGKMLRYIKETGGEREYLTEYKRRCESLPNGGVI